MEEAESRSLCGGGGWVLDALGVLQSGEEREVNNLVESACVQNSRGETLLHEAALGNHRALVAALVPMLPRHVLGMQDCRGGSTALEAERTRAFASPSSHDSGTDLYQSL